MGMIGFVDVHHREFATYGEFVRMMNRTEDGGDERIGTITSRTGRLSHATNRNGRNTTFAAQRVGDGRA